MKLSRTIRALDRAFARRSVSEAELARLTREIARLQGEFRAVHLRTHLQQTALLTAHQVRESQRLGRYAGVAGRHGEHQR